MREDRTGPDLIAGQATEALGPPIHLAPPWQHDYRRDPTLMPETGRRPYYIAAPKFVAISAGVRALYLLCHCLNMAGQNAFLYLESERAPLDPELLTPRLDRKIAERHFERGLTPIVLYPEIVKGNPTNAPVVVRYVLNFPGLLGGDQEYPAQEMRLAYSEVLAEAAGAGDNVLFIPVVDTRTFRRHGDGKRSGTCFYASKLKEVHGGEVFGLPPGSVEIYRSGPERQTPEELAELFNRSELFYCFENSALAIEAALCGCPAVFMFNAFFSAPIALAELGLDGFARGNETGEIERAKATVDRAAANYAATLPRFWQQLERFIAVTQARAAATPYPAKVVLDRGLSGSMRVSWGLVGLEAGLSGYVRKRRK